MFCGTLGFRGTPVEEYWARLYFSTHTEIHFDEHKSNYTLFRFTQTFLRPNKALLFGGKKLKITCKSLELTIPIRLHTVIHHSPDIPRRHIRMTIKRQQRPNTWSINSVVNQWKLTSSELISVLRTMLQRRVKRILIKHPTHATVYCLAKMTVAEVHMPEFKLLKIINALQLRVVYRLKTTFISIKCARC